MQAPPPSATQRSIDNAIELPTSHRVHRLIPGIRPHTTTTATLSNLNCKHHSRGMMFGIGRIALGGIEWNSNSVPVPKRDGDAEECCALKCSERQHPQQRVRKGARTLTHTQKTNTTGHNKWLVRLCCRGECSLIASAISAAQS